MEEHLKAHKEGGCECEKAGEHKSDTGTEENCPHHKGDKK